MKNMFIGFVLLLLPFSGNSNTLFDGTFFIENCVEKNREAFCFGYVSGIADILGDPQVKTTPPICIPRGTSNKTLLSIAADHFTKHEELFAFGASYGIKQAWEKMFPCADN